MSDLNWRLRDLRERIGDKRARLNELKAIMDSGGRALTDTEAREIVRMNRDMEIEMRELDQVEAAMGVGRHSQVRDDLHQNAAGCSLANLVRHAMGDRVDIGQDREWSQEYSRRTGMSARGTFIPFASINVERRALNTATGSQGGYMVPQLPGGFIDMIRPASGVLAAGATPLEVTAGELLIPKQTGATTAYMVTETGTITASDATFGQIRLSPKEVAVRTEFSRQLVASAPAVFEQIVEDDLRRTMATKIDYMALYGSGVGTEPVGLNATSGIGAPSEFAAATPTWGECLGVAAEVALDNALSARCAWVMNPALAMQLRGKSVDTGSGVFICSGNPPQIAGYRVIESGNVVYTPSSATDLWFGDWSQMIVATWGAVDVVIDPYSNAATSGVRMFAYGFFDVAVRHAESFSKGYYTA